MDTVRPKPALWLPLPPEVRDTTSLASFLRAFAGRSVGGQREMPARALLEAAALLDTVPPTDGARLEAVLATLDEEARRATADGTADGRYWEAVAHAVARLTEEFEAN